ncbi:fimbria/pilus periplasmic chaperone [Salmonella enterica]|nr:fimbria/pilus periplasmic chaperone [Salmonella enterica]
MPVVLFIIRQAMGGGSLVISNEQDYPILVQSVVMDSTRKKHGAFFITPPLFRLDAKQQSRLRVVNMGKTFPADRESLNWLCVKGIPPKNDDLWAEDSTASKKDVNLDIQVSVNSCIKLLVRPASINGNVEDAAHSVVWSVHGKYLMGRNSSPFYINISSIAVGETTARGDNNIPPFSDARFELTEKTAVSQVSWKLVTDYGSELSIQSPLSH